VPLDELEMPKDEPLLDDFEVTKDGIREDDIESFK